MSASAFIAACSGSGRAIESGGGGSGVDGGTQAGSGGSAGRGGAGGGGTGGSRADAGTIVPGPCDSTTSLAPARIWQLTDEQYVNAARQLFDFALSSDDAPKGDAKGGVGVYTNFSEARLIDAAALASYDHAAEAIASAVAARASALIPCAVTSDAGIADAADADACVAAYLRTTASRAFRRPASDEEVADLLALYRSAAATDGPAGGLGIVAQELLLSPFFIFRTEIGLTAATSTEPVALTPYEVASALSFTFLDSAPDDELWGLAEAGTLVDSATISREVDRLMDAPESQANLTRKVSYWLGASLLPARAKNTALFPEYSMSLAHDLEASTAAFVNDVVWSGRLGDLFTSSKVYVNDEIGRVYGIAGANGSTLTPVTLSAPERSAGILSQPGMLAAMSEWESVADPIDRGFAVYQTFMCGGDVGEFGPDPDVRDRDEAMSGNQRTNAGERARRLCGGCHSLFDPLGLAFERYDAIGRYSETKYVERDPATGAVAWKTAASPIDTAAVVSASLGPDLAGPIDGVGGLARRLHDAKTRIAFCAARQLVKYSIGFDAGPKNSCALREVQEKLERSESLSGVFRSLATSPGFQRRDPRP